MVIFHLGSFCDLSNADDSSKGVCVYRKSTLPCNIGMRSGLFQSKLTKPAGEIHNRENNRIPSRKLTTSSATESAPEACNSAVLVITNGCGILQSLPLSPSLPIHYIYMIYIMSNIYIYIEETRVKGNQVAHSNSDP